MQTVYTSYIWDSQMGAAYIVPVNSGQPGFTTITIRISDNWGSTDLGSNAIVRVTGSWGNGSGGILGDITIGRYGTFPSAPSGWSYSGGGLRRTLNNINYIQAPYPYSGGYGIGSNRFDLSPFNPPATNKEEWAATVDGLYVGGTSKPLVIFAYEINQSYSGNPPGWTPDYFVYGWEEQQSIGSIVGRPGGRPIDQQMQSIFCPTRKVDVSQSDFGVVGKNSVDVPSAIGGFPVLTAGVVDDWASNKDAEIFIIISPGNCIDGNPIYNPGTMPNTPNLNTGGQTIIIRETTKPPIDDPSGGGRRPVIFPTPGGGGTPAAEQYIALEVTPDPIAHDNTDIGSFKTKSFTIKNTGTVSVEVDEIVNTHPDNIFTFGMSSPNGIPFTIDPTEEFGGTAYFLPVNAVSYTELGYVKKEGNILRSFSITGTGTSSGNPGETPLRKIALFGDVFSSGDRNFLERTIGTTTLTTIRAINAGNLPITLNNVSLGGAGVFTTPGITSGFSLEVGAELPIDVSFTPVGAQEYLGTFTLNSNAQASDQVGFNPATGAITCNLRGEGTPELVLTRIMSFNIQNDGTFEDVLAGGSASAELDATITNIGNSTLLISQFQVQSPFSLELDVFGTFTVGSFEFYSLDTPLLIESGQTSQPFTIKFTPPTASNFVDDVVVVSNKTIGPESFEVRGLGLFEVPEEPEEPDGPILPDDEPPPGQEFDPGTVPSSALDGNGAACIPKECEVTYVYEYSSNGQIVT